MSVICDAIEKCWDEDADARLSPQCLLMRFQHLSRSNNGSCDVEIDLIDCDKVEEENDEEESLLYQQDLKDELLTLDKASVDSDTLPVSIR